MNKRILHRVLDIIIGIMCVMTVGAAAFAINMFHEDWNFNYDEEAFYYRLEDESFDTLVEMYYANELSGVKADDTLKQYYGVAKYFEAASYYKAYQDAGDKTQMEKYHERMEQAEGQMGKLNIVTEVIDEKLDL